MEQNTTMSSSSLSSSSPSSSPTMESKPTSLISAIAGSLSGAVQGVLNTAASTIQHSLHLVGDESSPSSSPSLPEKEEKTKEVQEGQSILSSASTKVMDAVDSVKSSLSSSVEAAEDKIVRPSMDAARVSLEKATDIISNLKISTTNEGEKQDGDIVDDDKENKQQKGKEEGNKTMSYSEYALEQFSRGGCTDKKLTMEMVAHIQRIADRTNDTVLHDMARKAHSAFAKGLHEAPGVHLTWITVEQANELVNLAIRTQDRSLADFARYCQSVAATTQLGVEPYPGKISQELEKGRLDLAVQGRTHSGPGYGAAFSTVPRQQGMTKSTSGTSIATKPSSSSSSSVSPSPSSPTSSSSPSSSPLDNNNSNSPGARMMKSYSTSNVLRTDRYGFGPSPSTSGQTSPTTTTAPSRPSFGSAPGGFIPRVYSSSPSPTSSSTPSRPSFGTNPNPTSPTSSSRASFGNNPNPTSPTSSSAPSRAPFGVSPSPTSSSTPSRSPFGNNPNPISPTSAATPARPPFGNNPNPTSPTAAATPARPPFGVQGTNNNMQKSGSAYNVPPSKAAAIASGYIPLSQRTPGMGMMQKSSSSTRADVASGTNNNNGAVEASNKPATTTSTNTQQPVKKSMVKSFSTNSAIMPSPSTPVATDLKLTMDMVAHLQRIADRTGDSILHDTARRAHSACAKGLNEAPGVHLTKITPEQANELVNLAIRTQDHGLADFARYCQSVAATTQLGIEPSPGKISQELEKGRLELAQQGRSYTGPGYGAAFASLNKSNSGHNIALKGTSSPKDSPSSPSSSSSPSSPSLLSSAAESTTSTSSTTTTAADGNTAAPAAAAEETHDAQGQIKADSVKAEPFVPLQNKKFDP